MNKTEEKPNTSQEQPLRKKWPRWAKILLGVVAALVVVVGAGVLYVNGKLDLLRYNDGSVSQMGTIDASEDLYLASIVSDMNKEGETAVNWLADQGLDEYNVIHIQGVMGSAAQQGRTGALDDAAANDGFNLVTQQTAEWNAETAQQIVQSVIDSGKEFNVIYAENDDMAKGAVAALDKANISHGVGKDVIVMGFDCNKWALEELLAGNWNYDGQCNPFQASYIDAIIKDLQAGKAPAEKTIIMDEKGSDASTITQEDVDNYGI